MVSSPMSNRQGIEPNEKLLKSIVSEASVSLHYQVYRFSSLLEDLQHNSEGFEPQFPDFSFRQDIRYKPKYPGISGP